MRHPTLLSLQASVTVLLCLLGLCSQHKVPALLDRAIHNVGHSYVHRHGWYTAMHLEGLDEDALRGLNDACLVSKCCIPLQARVFILPFRRWLRHMHNNGVEHITTHYKPGSPLQHHVP